MSEQIQLFFVNEHGTTGWVLSPDRFNLDVDDNGQRRIYLYGNIDPIPAKPLVPPVPTKNKVRRNDPDTSFSAALAQTTEKSRKQYSLIYRALHQIGPMTDSEIQQTFEKLKFAHSPSGLRSRRAELVEAGWVRATALRRPSSNGHPSTVWEAIWEGPIHG